MKLSNNRVKEYHQTRKREHRHLICHAPFSNINFEQNGNMTACCFNRTHVLGEYPKQSILDAWTGSQAQELRTRIKSEDLGGGCKLCGELINAGNFSGSRAKYYDDYADPAPNGILPTVKDLLGLSTPNMPKVFEFEISNTCNLECTMCSGYFSSKIRDKREGLPPMKNPYDDSFVEQVTEFMPHLTDMKFLGGEPFMIKQYLSIWEKVLEVNPKIRVHITTNATLLHGRIKEVVSRLKAGFVISIDSVEPKNYARIRKGGDLPVVLENVEELRKIAKLNSTYVTIAACVMRSNWMDLPSLVQYANDRDMNIHFNLVWNPEEESIRFLSGYEISDIVAGLESRLTEITGNGKVQKGNLGHLEEVVDSLKYWAKEREGVAENLEINSGRLLEEKQKLDGIGNQLLEAYLAYYTQKHKPDSGLSFAGIELMKKVQDIKEAANGNKSFFESYMAMATIFSELAYPERNTDQFNENKALVFELITSDYQIQEALNEMCQGGLISQIDFLHATPKQQLLETLQAKFYIKG